MLDQNNYIENSSMMSNAAKNFNNQLERST